MGTIFLTLYKLLHNKRRRTVKRQGVNSRLCVLLASKRKKRHSKPCNIVHPDWLHKILFCLWLERKPDMAAKRREQLSLAIHYLRFRHHETELLRMFDECVL